MSKVNTIKFTNFKAIDKFEANFNGCTAIVTAGNEKGKTSFLKGITDRIKFIRPDVMVKEGAEAGKGELILTTGERFEWDFDVNGKDRLVYYDAEAIKQTVTMELGKRFFPPTFDVDKFLNSSPKDQVKQLQKIVGLDFTDVDLRYDKAYAIRTTKNQEAERFHVKLSKMLEVPKVLPVDLTDLQQRKEAERTRLNDVYKANKLHNESLRKEWERTKEMVNRECATHNEKQAENRTKFNKCWDAMVALQQEGFNVDDSKVREFVDYKLAEVLDLKEAATFYPKEPTYIEEMPLDNVLRTIDAEILSASEINTEAKKYIDYIEYKNATDAAKIEALEADENVKEIEEERKRMIEGANFPKGILMDSTGIFVDGFPFNKNQISTSKLYTTALRIASMNIGEVRALYFDASYLDKNTLHEIEQWAEENDLQLLIERPDWEGGQIRYELIEN